MKIEAMLLLIVGCFTLAIGLMYFFHIRQKQDNAKKYIMPTSLMLIGLVLAVAPVVNENIFDDLFGEKVVPNYQYLRGTDLFDPNQPVSTGSYEEAAEWYRRGTALWNPHKIAFDSTTEAMAYLDTSIELFETTEAYTARGQLKVQLGRMREAVLDYNRAIELNPEFGNAFYNRATVSYIMGNPDLACEDWKRAEELNVAAAKAALDQMCR